MHDEKRKEGKWLTEHDLELDALTDVTNPLEKIRVKLAVVHGLDRLVQEKKLIRVGKIICPPDCDPYGPPKNVLGSF